jgi:hypothetical protein
MKAEHLIYRGWEPLKLTGENKKKAPLMKRGKNSLITE